MPLLDLAVAASHYVASQIQLPLLSGHSSPFHWKQCRDDDPHYQCGWIEVPLDYTNASDPRTVTLATTMYQPNPGHKSARTLIVEPGGPGGSGTEYIWRKGPTLTDWYTSNQYDVLGFDPRASCFPEDAYRDRWLWTEYAWPETQGYATLDRLDAMNEATMQGCKTALGDLPRFLSTAFVARDVDAIREALGEPELTAYMVSYGTGIGTFGSTGASATELTIQVKMFPDKVGRVVLDGMEYVRDGRHPDGWATASLDNVTDAFEVGFLGECVQAGPERCALVHHVNDTHAELSSRMHKLFKSVAARPVPGLSSQGPGIVTYERLTGMLYESLYRPVMWKEVAQRLAELEKGNATAVLEAMHKSGFSYDPTRLHRPSAHPDKYSSDAHRSVELSALVICGDSYDAEQHNLTWWGDLHSEMLQKSWISASPRLYHVLSCRHFDWDVAEVYRGDMNTTLANPIILVTSPFDPATPINSARKLAEEMGNNARLLNSIGYGHSSNADESDCSKAVIRDYILYGKVPGAAETTCHANKKPFDSDYVSALSDPVHSVFARF